MLKKTLKVFLYLLLGFTLFSFWMSPRLGGLISMGKDHPDQVVDKLKFDTVLSEQHYNLIYEPQKDNANLKQLRAEFQLDTIITGCKSGFEKVMKIQSWVQSRWKHDGDNSANNKDALFILKEAEKGKRFRCVEYSIVAGQCLTALGFTVRPVGLMTKDVNDVESGAGHAVNEVYLYDLKKWILIDPQFDVITVKDSVPLNSVELQNCIANNISFDIINPNKTITKEDYIKWIGPYLYYFYVSINNQKIGILDRIIGNKKQLTLYPSGASKPTYFQKIFRINTTYYTHSIKDFYPILKSE